jgi:cytochrome P450
VSITLDPADLDLQAPGFIRDPYPYYEILRQVDPVHHSTRLDVWLVTPHDLVSEVFSDAERFGKGWPEGVTPFGGPRPAEFAALDDLPTDMQDSDPPDHTRLRRLVSRAFTPRAVERQRSRVVEIVDELIDDIQQRPEFDAVADFALPIPARIISEILGVPSSDYPLFQQWTADFVRSFDITQGAEAKHRGMTAHLRLVEYFTHMVAERRRRPGPDMISALIEVEDGGDTLGHGDLLAMCVLLLFAGYETTLTLRLFHPA